MNWGWFDNKYKESLDTERISVDPDEIWAAIENDVDAFNSKRKKRRFAFWFFSIGTVLTAVGIVSTLLFKRDINFAENNITKSGQEEIIIKGNVPSELAEQKINEPFNDLMIDNSKNEDSHNISTLKESEKNREHELKINRITHSNSTNIEEKENRQFPIKSNLKQFNSTYINRPANNVQSKLSSISKIESLPLKPFSITSTQTLDWIDFTTEKEILLNNSEKNNAEDLILDKNKTTKLYFSFSGGLSWVNLNMKEKEDDFREIYQLNKKATTALEAIHLGLSINANHKSGFGIRSGIEYTRLNEKVESSKTIINKDSIIGAQYHIVNLDDDTIAIVGNVPHEISTVYKKRFFNSYTLWDIPVIVSYCKGTKNFLWGIETGIYANVSLNAKGNYLLDELTHENISPIYRPNIGLSYHVGFLIQKKLTRKIDFSFAPKARFFSKEFTNDANPIQKKYALFGTDLRLKYSF